MFILNKNELRDAVSEKTELTKAQSKEAIEAVFESITEALEDHDTVKVYQFGTFSVGERKARKGHNPSTGEEIDIPATHTAKWKPSKTVKDKVKGEA